MEINTVTEIVTYVLSIVGGAIGGISVWKKTIAGDAVQSARQNAETNIIQHLQETRNDAIKEKDDAFVRLEKIETENAALLEKIRSLENDMSILIAQTKLQSEIIRGLQAQNEFCNNLIAGRME